MRLCPVEQDACCLRLTAVVKDRDCHVLSPRCQERDQGLLSQRWTVSHEHGEVGHLPNSSPSRSITTIRSIKATMPHRSYSGSRMICFPNKSSNVIACPGSAGHHESHRGASCVLSKPLTACGS